MNNMNDVGIEHRSLPRSKFEYALVMWY